MKPTLKVREAKEILSLIPFQLGFQPKQSVVFVSLRGTRKQVGLIARVDADEVASAHGDEVLQQLVAHCIQDKAQQVLVVLYVDSPEEDEMAASALTTSARLATRIAKLGVSPLRIEEMLVVQDGMYGHFSSAEQCDLIGSLQANAPSGATRLCSDHKGETQELCDTAISAHMVFEGKTAVTHRAALGEVRESSLSARMEARDAYQRANRLLEKCGKAEHQEWRLNSLEAWIEKVNCSESELSPSELGSFARLLEDIPARDAILISLTSAGSKAALEFIAGYATNAALTGKTDRLARTAISEITDPKKGRRPHRSNTDRARWLLHEVISHAAPEQHAAPRTLLALLAWWEGHGALARRHLEEMPQGETNYSLAQLVTTALNYGLAPGWQRE